jgi:hypothetical protein
MTRYHARRPSVGDPTSDLASFAQLIEYARVWAGASPDPVERYRRREIVLDAQAALAARQCAPGSGRISELDQAFTAMGYRDRDRD